jgi:carbon storage regulator CsrA
MLVLSRRKMERIQIGGVEITILQIGSGRVQIGIQAPRDVKVDRLGPDESEKPAPLPLDPVFQIA